MRYLSEIRDKDGHSLPFLVDKIENIGKYSFSIYDEETQETVDVDTKDLQPIHAVQTGFLPSYSLAFHSSPILHSLFNCLGITVIKTHVYMDEEVEFMAAAVHNKDAAKLYRFIEFIETQSTWDRTNFDDDSDIYFEIDTMSVSLNRPIILGEYAPFVVIMNIVENRYWAYTLYDFLLDLCRLHKLNVMSYETIRIANISAYSEGTTPTFVTTIKLLHNSEADRFFTEMYARIWGNGIKWYVSKIQVDGKPVDHAIWPCASNLVVTTKNIETGEEKRISDFPIDDCYGFSSWQPEGGCIIVPHTSPAAQLYKYMKWPKIYLEQHERISGADRCRWDVCANIDTLQDAEKKTLEILTSYYTIKLCEPCGSVICVKTFEEDKYLSLYDFLISVCRSTKLSIMAYSTVQFIHETVDDLHSIATAEIMFDHGKEADRFFTKMFMQAMIEDRT